MLAAERLLVARAQAAPGPLAVAPTLLCPTGDLLAGVGETCSRTQLSEALNGALPLVLGAVSSRRRCFTGDCAARRCPESALTAEL